MIIKKNYGNYNNLIPNNTNNTVIVSHYSNSNNTIDQRGTSNIKWINVNNILVQCFE